MGLLMLAATAWAAFCPATLPTEYAADARSSGRVVLVATAERLLGVYDNDALVPGTCFSVQLGPGADDGPKRREGDGRTPEGWYRIAHRNAKSAYHKSVAISYPNFLDVTRGLEDGTIDEPTFRDLASSLRPTFDELMDAVQRGLITYETANQILRASGPATLPDQSSPLGGNIMIHGTPARYGGKDWTLGCIAVTNREMDRVYDLAVAGTAVLIVPTLGESESAAH